MGLTTWAFGPLTKGTVEGANPALDLTGACRRIEHGYYSGVSRLMASIGSDVAITLMDDQGTPAEVTDVLLCEAWSDGALAVAHSSFTNKAYLYRLDASLTGWYDAAGTFTASATATPIGVLWSTMPTPGGVTMAEGAGTAIFAITNALSKAALSFKTRSFNGAVLTDLTANLDGTGALAVYFAGVFAFQGTLFGWGYDKGAVAATAYRPELLRFGGPAFGALDIDGKGTFTVGHRIRSVREAVMGVTVAGDTAYLGTPFSLWPLTGFGRDTWEKSKPLDESYGRVGLHAGCTAGDAYYGWSANGPLRRKPGMAVEPLWDRLPDTPKAVVNPQNVVAVYDVDRDQVCWFYRGGTAAGNQLLVAFDVARDVFLGPATDVGILVGCAGLVGPVNLSPGGAGGPGPVGPPTSPITSSIGATSAVASWDTGDTNSDCTTTVRVRRVTTSAWTVAAVVAATTLSATITGLSAGVDYEWEVYHTRNAQESTHAGPTAFTTSGSTTPLLAPTMSSVSATDLLSGQGTVYWINSGEASVQTVVYLAGPFDTEPDLASYSQLSVAASGASSAPFNVVVGGTYWARAKHVRSGYTDSDVAAAVSGPITYSP